MEQRFCPVCKKPSVVETCKCGTKTVPLFDKNRALSREFLLARGTCCDGSCKNCPYK